MKIRLAKILANAGIASRRTAEKLILERRIRVDGELICQPQKNFDPERAKITLDGKPLRAEPKKVYYLLHKPLGYVCSNKRLQGEKLVVDLFRDFPFRLFTVGRLDKETSGLLIVTNDGDFSQKVIHPSSGLVKEYVVKTNKEITHENLVQISNGIQIDGTTVRPAFVKKVRRNTFKIGVKEGKKHEVRKLAAEAKLNVLELKRIRIGSLQLGPLPYGQYRTLRERELENFML